VTRLQVGGGRRGRLGMGLHVLEDALFFGRPVQGFLACVLYGLVLCLQLFDGIMEDFLGVGLFLFQGIEACRPVFGCELTCIVQGLLFFDGALGLVVKASMGHVFFDKGDQGLVIPCLGVLVPSVAIGPFDGRVALDTLVGTQCLFDGAIDFRDENVNVLCELVPFRL